MSRSFVEKKKRTEEERKMARKRKKLKIVFPNCWMKTFFRIHHNRQAKNAKTGETIFQETEK